MGIFFAVDPLSVRTATEEEDPKTLPSVLNPTVERALPAWMEIELEGAASGEVFRIRDLVGTPILLETFAVWCPICLRQQKEIARLVEIAGDQILYVSLDIDPNEDLEKVRSHVARNGLEGYFAVAPTELTQLLIETFGLEVASAPRAPIVLVEADGASRLPESGVKSTDRLLEILGLEPGSEPSDG